MEVMFVSLCIHCMHFAYESAYATIVLIEKLQKYRHITTKMHFFLLKCVTQTGYESMDAYCTYVKTAFLRS